MVYKSWWGSTMEFLVFKHNQHQIEQARQLANELGSGTFMQKNL